ncbi:HU family DNA-binding protein [bacterium]|nr:MAG: HU family DNA-binding protein [bacterium]
MTKQQLIELLATESNLTKRQSERTLNTLLGIIERTVAAGERVSISGFGTFDTSNRAARKGVDPRTGAPSPSRR